MSRNKRKVLTIKSFDELQDLIAIKPTPAVEELEQKHRPHTTVAITVNGQVVRVANQPLTYAELADLGGCSPGHNPSITFSFCGNGPGGTLFAGERIDPESGMVVNVTVTGNA